MGTGPARDAVVIIQSSQKLVGQPTSTLQCNQETVECLPIPTYTGPISDRKIG